MLDTICDVMKQAYKNEWISTRDGNASYKRANDKFLYVTPSGVKKQHMNSESIIKLEMGRNNEVKRTSDEYQDKIIGLEPTGELLLHILLQKNPPENRVVIHLHPTHIIAAMYAGLDLQELAKQFPEINRYTRVGPTVPIIPPVSKELAYASIEKLNLKENGTVDFDIIGLKQHGIIAIAKDAWTAFEHCERLEHICRIALLGGISSYIKHCE